MLTSKQIEATAAWIKTFQATDGEIPWYTGGKWEAWDQVQAAMGMICAGDLEPAMAAFRHLARTQSPRGSWVAEKVDGFVTKPEHESNHAAYIATGLWYYFVATGDRGFLAEMWPTVDRAIDFVVDLQEEDGTMCWARRPDGSRWQSYLITGSSSVHGSLVCAQRIAEELSHDRPDWWSARERLGNAIRDREELFTAESSPDPVGRFSMDWYYPVLGGAVRGPEGRERLLDPVMVDKFIEEGVGCRCVADAPWYTLAETCELVLAHHAVGLHDRAREIFSWSRSYRMENGGYETGRVFPEDVCWPPERNAYTPATVLMVQDTLVADSATSDFFVSLSGEELDEGDSVQQAIAS
jgi:hypothetical protein